MIPVAQADEPKSFDKKVRQRGLRAIGELVGAAPTKKRRGRPRKKAADKRGDIPATAFPPYWQDATDDLLDAYARVCNYACLYIEHVTGAATVDHWVPKSTSWDRVYEWSNYRLACSLFNSRKNAFFDIVDPFDVKPGMFGLDLTTLKVVPGPDAEDDDLTLIQSTITRLGLDGIDYSNALDAYLEAYEADEITYTYLARRAPFLAAELRRQGKLRPGDV